MAGGVYFWIGLNNITRIWAYSGDKVGNACCAAAKITRFADSAICLNGDFLRIAQKCKGQAVFFGKLLMALGRILADAKNLHARRRKIGIGLANNASFLRTARRVVFRIKIHQNIFYKGYLFCRICHVPRQRVHRAILVGEIKIWGFGAVFEHRYDCTTNKNEEKMKPNPLFKRRVANAHARVGV